MKFKSRGIPEEGTPLLNKFCMGLRKDRESMEKKMAARKQPYFIVALIIACMIGFGDSAYAEVATEIKNQTVKATVSGTVADAAAGAPVSFCLTKDGNPACIEQGVIAEGGAYSFEFLANPKFGYGVFDYSVKARGSDVRTGTLEIADVETLETLLPKLVGASSASELQALMSELEPALNMPVYEAINAGEWYRILYNEISGENALADTAALYQLMKQSVVTAAINGGIAGIIQNGKLQYTDVLGLDDVAAAAYESELSEKGTAAVNKYIMAKKYDRIGDCTAALRKLILTNRITHNALADLAVVQANLLADGEELGLSLSKAKGKEKEVSRQLVLNGAETPEALITAYNNICNSLTAVTGGGTGSGTGGGGTGGSSGVFGGYQPSIQPAEAANAAGSGFNDMDDYAWAQAAVTKLKEIGAVSGKSETEFAPGDNVTREEFVKMILYAFGLMRDEAGSAQSSFSDVDQEQWYAPYVARAAGLGLVSGVSDAEFGVGYSISRQDMAAISFRALRYKVSAFDTDIEGIEFTDLNEIGEYARTPALLLKKLQVVNGYPDGSFRPLQTASRAEAAQMIFSMIMLGGE